MSEPNRSIRLPESWAADWVLDRALGSGAFSTVYRAVRRDRPSVEAAIKIISVPGSDAELAALRAEGMDAAQSQSYFDAIAREYISEILYSGPSLDYRTEPVTELRHNGNKDSQEEHYDPVYHHTHLNSFYPI